MCLEFLPKPFGKPDLCKRCSIGSALPRQTAQNGLHCRRNTHIELGSVTLKQGLLQESVKVTVILHDLRDTSLQTLKNTA
jgi:hypothetical protein